MGHKKAPGGDRHQEQARRLEVHRGRRHLWQEGVGHDWTVVLHQDHRGPAQDGYDLDNGSHPQIPAYNKYNSTCNLWFKKVTGDRPWVKVIYVALEKLNKVILINHNNQVKSIVEEAVENAWPLGIKRHKEVKALGHELHEIKMNSSLWQTCGGLGTGDPDIDMNRIVDKIIDNLGKIKIRSVGVIKINGQTSIFLTSPGLEVVSFPDPLAIESEAENLSRLEVFLNIGAITPLGAAPAGFAQQCPRCDNSSSEVGPQVHEIVESYFFRVSFLPPPPRDSLSEWANQLCAGYQPCREICNCLPERSKQLFRAAH